MTRNYNMDTALFDCAVSDAFRDDHGCGALGDIDVLSKRRDVNDILAMAQQREADARFARLSRKPAGTPLMLISAAAILLLAVGGGIIFHFASAKQNPMAKTETTANWFGEVQNPGNALFLGDTLAAVNAPVPVDELIRSEEGEAMLRLPTGIDWYMKEHASGKIRPLSAAHLKVALQSGENWFRVDPNRKGPAFSVETPMGQIHVTGTIFVVNVDNDDVRVTLLKGGVWITLPSGNRKRLDEGHSLRLTEETPAVLSEEAAQQYETQLALLNWTDGAHSLADDTYDTSEHGDRLSVARTHKTAASDKNGPAALTQQQLLKAIRRERQQHNWGKVVELYQRLIKMAPQSETAIVSRVSLGDICLSKLHRYGDALNNYNRYLQSGHTALLPEATFGKCNALKGLGKRAQETRCLETFVTRYPGAFQVGDAQTRLNALR
ncbi:MAG: FecR domain-containing protein [Deltaproteobacteria bacterium]|nr:FecR domain-containing protein [Deltaproteobacteria bacterium]